MGVAMNLFAVFEIRLKVYLLQDISQEQTYMVMGDYVDSYLAKSPAYLALHEKNCFKNYVFDQFYPVEADGVYKKDKVYTVRIRALDSDLVQYFIENLANHYNQQMKGLTLEVRKIAKKLLSEIYSITPVIIKCEAGESQQGGYWKNNLSFEQYEERLKVNLIKKYNQFTGMKINEDFPLYRQIELTNKKPIAVPYKGIKLLGDKVCIHAEENELAQEMLYIAIATGLGELNARGCGFLNYRYL